MAIQGLLLAIEDLWGGRKVLWGGGGSSWLLKTLLLPITNLFCCLCQGKPRKVIISLLYFSVRRSEPIALTRAYLIMYAFNECICIYTIIKNIRTKLIF